MVSMAGPYSCRFCKRCNEAVFSFEFLQAIGAGKLNVDPKRVLEIIQQNFCFEWGRFFFKVGLETVDEATTVKVQDLVLDEKHYHSCAAKKPLPDLQALGKELNKIDPASKSRGSQQPSMENCMQQAVEVVDVVLVPAEVQDPEEKAKWYIERYGLQPSGEGGFYKETFRSSTEIVCIDSMRFQGKHIPASSSIVYLLAPQQFSAWHRLQSDETVNLLDGGPVKIHMIDPTSGELTTHILRKEGVAQITIPGQQWMAFELVDPTSYCFMGITVSPAWMPEFYELANREELIQAFPQHKDIIIRLTSDNTVTS